MESLQDGSFGTLALVLMAGMLPLAAVTVTAFAKIAVVIFIVRNAIGIQQLPPNAILYGLSIILSAYIAMPVMNESYNAVRDSGLAMNEFEHWLAAGETASGPLREFLLKYTDQKQLAFFENSLAGIWGEGKTVEIDRNNLSVLVPAFMMSELTRAFEIGFMLYLPFMAIDIIVTTILIALGMMMVPPTTVSIPFKLMLLIALDGWTKIVHGLVLSYSA